MAQQWRIYLQCRRCRRRRFHTLVEKILWSTPVFLPGESHGQRSLGAYSPTIALQRVRHAELCKTPQERAPHWHLKHTQEWEPGPRGGACASQSHHQFPSRTTKNRAWYYKTQWLKMKILAEHLMKTHHIQKWRTMGSRWPCENTAKGQISACQGEVPQK